VSGLALTVEKGHGQRLKYLAIKNAAREPKLRVISALLGQYREPLADDVQHFFIEILPSIVCEEIGQFSALAIAGKHRIMLRPAVAGIERDRQRGLEVVRPFKCQCRRKLDRVRDKSDWVGGLAQPWVLDCANRAAADYGIRLTILAPYQAGPRIGGDRTNVVEIPLGPGDPLLEGQPSNELVLVITIRNRDLKLPNTALADRILLGKLEQTTDMIAPAKIEMRERR
jgi:hypothetical protein